MSAARHGSAEHGGFLSVARPTEAWPRAALLGAIAFYRRHLSPYKGFSCAIRVHTGACSCSRFGQRAIARHGAWRGLGLLRGRLARCGEVHARHHAGGLPGQRGFLDCSCDLPCDLPCHPDAGDLFNCLPCDCGDCGERRRSDRRDRRKSRAPVSTIIPGPDPMRRPRGPGRGRCSADAPRSFTA